MKQQILDEIKRLAIENGGKAPGKRAFETATGITEGQWYGTIWFRWNDAIKEAGLVPNTKSTKLSSKHVLEWYAKACREYGRPPISVEYRHFAKNNAGCPSPDTLTRHFGSKANLLKNLHSYAIETNDQRLLSLLPDPDDRVDIDATEHEDEGWVYLLKSGLHFKIGRSNDLEKRIKQITIAMPEKVDLVHAIRTDDANGIEAYWHNRFADFRANGEWFALKPEHVKAFKRRKFQ